MPAVAFDTVDIVFGDRPRTALPLLDQGLSRDQILAETGQVLGVAGCSLDGRARRDLRADGPVRLGQVDAAARRQPAQHGGPRLGAWSRTTGTRSTSPPATPRRCAACGCSGSPWCSSSSRCCRGERWPRTWRSGSSCAACRRGRTPTDRHGEAGAGASRAVGRQVRARAFGRHAAAGRARPRLRHRRRHPADGRAVLAPSTR